MPVFIIRDDITRVHADAIVNAANSSLLGGGGVDGAIHRAAGPELLAECRTLGGCPTGEARITKGYCLPAKYVIHTVGPVWHGGHQGEPELLASCYRCSLELAEKHGCTTVAFPLISAGVYGYPKDKALRMAMDTIREHAPDDMTVYMVIFDHDSALLSRALYDDISEFIDDRYAGRHEQMFARSEAPLPSFSAAPICSGYSAPCSDSFMEDASMSCDFDDCFPEANAVFDPDADLGQLLSNLDEGFSGTLLHLIDQRGLTDAQCYKRANIDRKLFSKIRSDAHYRPSKHTALAFAVALELTIDQTADLLRRAGYALSPSSKFDVIVEYFIRRGEYDVMRINEALFAFDQPLLAG